MFVDTHNHTKYFSSDAKMSIEELVNTCKSRGIPKCAITEHYDMDYPHPEDVMVCDLDKYYEAFKVWKELSTKENGPELLLGLEMAYQPHLPEKIDAIAKSYPFDIVILSNHYFRGEDVYFSNSCYSITRKERHSEYIGIMAEMAERVTEYDQVAHYDYIDRYNKDLDSAVFYEDCPKEFDRLFEVLISKEKALEINTRSIEARKNRNPALIMPDSRIITRYLEMGGKLISLGSDSHTPNTLGINFEETANYLKSLGVNELCYFKNRKPVLQTIN